MAVKVVTRNHRRYIEQRDDKGRFVARERYKLGRLAYALEQEKTTGSIRSGQRRKKLVNLVEVEQSFRPKGVRRRAPRGDYQYYVTVRLSNGDTITRRSFLEHQTIAYAREEAITRIYEALSAQPDENGNLTSAGDREAGKQLFDYGRGNGSLTIIDEGVVRYARA